MSGFSHKTPSTSSSTSNPSVDSSDSSVDSATVDTSNSSGLDSATSSGSSGGTPPSTPTYDAAGAAETDCELLANGDVSQLLGKFDWTDETGQKATAKSEAMPAWKAEFKTVFAGIAKSDSDKKKARKAARKAANGVARPKIVVHAEALATARAVAVSGSDAAFAGSLDSASKSAIADFESGASGAKSKHYATALTGKKASEMAAMLNGDNEVVDGTVSQVNSTLGCGKPQWAWEFTDGSVVRVKPDGDSFGSDPMFAVEVKKKGASAPGQGGVAAKIDEGANAVPKGPADINNPYQAKYKEQQEAFQSVLIKAGHRQAAPE